MLLHELSFRTEWAAIVAAGEPSPAARSLDADGRIPAASALDELGWQMIRDLEAFLADALSRPAAIAGWRWLPRVAMGLPAAGTNGAFRTTADTSSQPGVEP